MAKRITLSTLNASTIDILNVIRMNANAEYQNAVPEITKATDIPKVGEVIYGTPAFSNYFISALINRIALVRVRSANFNNMYKELKKGYLEFGETVEEVFVNIAKARDFSVEKGEAREFKRTIPDVRSAFHAMNWRVQYPITIEDMELRQAFLSINGVQDLIAKLVDSIYNANEYDEYLLFKYLMIKAISHGKMYPVSIGDGTDIHDAAVQYRGMSNNLEFMNSKYNSAGVRTTTRKDDQYIFMDAFYNAKYDVNVLASAFNMDKATFMGHLKLIDSWNTFDNERFDVIRANSDGIEEVTADELALMADVKAVLVDKEWFQIYDNLDKMTEQYCASGMYWNYFYNVWKTVSSSPFSNAIVFVTSTAQTALPASITLKIADKDASTEATVFTLTPQLDNTSLAPSSLNFHQTQALTEAGIAVHKFGGIMIPASQNSTAMTIEFDIDGTKYTGKTTIDSTAQVGDTVVCDKA